MKRMMYLLLVVFAAAGLWGCSLSEPVQERILRVANYGYTKTRYSGIQKAVERFNDEHPDVHYTLEVNDYLDGIWDWDSYVNGVEELKLDILLIPSDYLGLIASQGLLLPLDDVIHKERFQKEYFAPLVPSTQYEGHNWGFLVETDARMVYWNKKVLEQLGYSREEIEQLPEYVRSGALSLYDLAELGKEAVEQGYSEYAIVHRPRNGLFFYMMARQFDAFSLDQKGNVTFNEENFARMLEFFRNNALACASPQPENWSETNDVFLQGRAAVYFGASWSIYDSIVEKNGDAEIMEEMYVATLFPGIEHGEAPFTMSNAMLSGISSQCEYPEDVKEILENAYSDWETLAVHARETYRFPVSNSVASSSVFQENSFLSEKLYMMDYTSYMPNLKDNQRWFQALHQAVRSVENGTGDPWEVARTLAQDIEGEF